MKTQGPGPVGIISGLPEPWGSPASLSLVPSMQIASLHVVSSSGQNWVSQHTSLWVKGNLKLPCRASVPCGEKVMDVWARDGCIAQGGLCWLWVLGKHLSCLYNFPRTHSQFTPLWAGAGEFPEGYRVTKGKEAFIERLKMLTFPEVFSSL